MSIKTTLQQSSTFYKHNNPIGLPPNRTVPTTWVRNPSWVTLPTVLATEQKVVALFAVFPSYSSVAFNISGAYTVDWGDGTTQNFASGATASRDYDYTSSALANTNAPVTFTASTSTVNRTAHGYTNGMQVQFWNIVTTTGIAEAAQYYVINATANTFQIASSSTSTTPVTFTGDGSAALLPYKQAIITITPQAANSLTNLNFNILPTSRSALTGGAYQANFLDIIISGTSIGSLTIGAATPNVTFRMLEQAQLISSNLITAHSYMFNNCQNLQSVPIWTIRTTAATQLSSMFLSCNKLTYGPTLDTSSATLTDAMFQNCFNLVTVPRYNTTSVTAMASMFQNCYSLRSLPALNTAAATLMGNYLNSCHSLTEVPALNLSASTTNASIMASCSSLSYVPSLKVNTAANWNGTGMFSSCFGLKGIGQLDLARCNNTGAMFSGCTTLQSVPWTSINMSTSTATASMFASCASLSALPDITLGSVINSIDFLGNTGSLTSIGKITMLTTSTGVILSSSFSNASSLKYISISAPSATVTNMTSTFSGCSALQTVYWDFATNVGTATAAIFNTCNSLVSHPPITVAPGTIQSNFVNPYSGAVNVRRGGISGPSNNITIGPIMASVSDFNTYYMNTIGKASAVAQTLTITNCYASNQKNLSVSSAPSGSTTANMTITTGLAVGMTLGGSTAGGDGSNARTVTGTVSSSTITATAHGLPNGTRVSFGALGTVTGLTTYTVYYVINATTDTFQLSTTSGGSAITFGGTTSTSMTLKYISTITGITANTSITVDLPLYCATGTWTFRSCDITNPHLRGWNITG